MTVRSILSMFCGTRIGMVALLLALGMGGLAVSAENDKKSPDKDKVQGTLHTVEARVTSPSGTGAGTNVLAEKQPGSFTIPKGSTGAKLKYSFHDPKSDYTSTKLRGSNIYSVTEKRYMHELDKDPNFSLPPGEYKFVVGGSPGATGSLSYTTVPSTDTNPPTGPPDQRKKGYVSSSPRDPTLPPSGPITPGGEEVLLNLPKDFDVTFADGAKEHPWVFQFRGENVTMQSRNEETSTSPETGKTVHTYQTAITGTFRRGILKGKYIFHTTGGHFGTGVHYSVGLVYKYWVWGDVTAQADSNTTTRGLLNVVIDLNGHKHTSRVSSQDATLPWGPWRDVTADWEDASKVAIPWKPQKFTIVLKLPVGELQSSQKLTSPEPVPPIPDPKPITTPE